MDFKRISYMLKPKGKSSRNTKISLVLLLVLLIFSIGIGCLLLNNNKTPKVFYEAAYKIVRVAVNDASVDVYYDKTNSKDTEYYKFYMSSEEQEWDSQFWVNKNTGVLYESYADGTIVVYKKSSEK